MIVDFIRRKLKVGGVLYISYNTQPGWAAFAPMRQLLTQHAAVVGTEATASSIASTAQSLSPTRCLPPTPSYAKANPRSADRVEVLKTQNRHYLAHEYFNRDWHPMHFSTMVDWLAPAKLNFACSANCSTTSTS